MYIVFSFVHYGVNFIFFGIFCAHFWHFYALFVHLLFPLIQHFMYISWTTRYPLDTMDHLLILWGRRLRGKCTYRKVNYASYHVLMISFARWYMLYQTQGFPTPSGDSYFNPPWIWILGPICNSVHKNTFVFDFQPFLGMS